MMPIFIKNLGIIGENNYGNKDVFIDIRYKYRATSNQRERSVVVTVCTNYTVHYVF